MIKGARWCSRYACVATAVLVGVGSWSAPTNGEVAPKAPAPSSSPAADPAKQEKLAELIKNRFVHDLGDDGSKLMVNVTPLFGGHFAVSITGELDSQKQVNDDEKTAGTTLAKIRKDDPTSIPDDKDAPDFIYKVEVAKPKDPQQIALGSIKRVMNLYLADDRVSVRVQSLPKREFKVYLSGLLPSEKAKAALRDTAALAALELNATFAKGAADSAAKAAAAATGKAAPEAGALIAAAATARAAARAARAAADAPDGPFSASPPPQTQGNQSGYPHINPVTGIILDDILIDPRDEIQRRFVAGLADKRLQVTVTFQSGRSSFWTSSPQPADAFYYVGVSGSVNNAQQRDGVRAQLRKIKDTFSPGELPIKVNANTTVDSNHLWTDTSGLYVADAAATDFWTIRYLGGQGKADLQQQAVIDSLVDALNFAYGDKDNKAVMRDGNELHLRGKQTDILKMKTTLALVDAAQPQVQMDFYAVQLSGSQKEVAQIADNVEERIRSANTAMQSISPHLKLSLQDSENDLESELSDPNTALAQVYEAMNPRVYRLFIERKPTIKPFDLSFTPVESLILLGVSKHRIEIVQQLQNRWMSTPFWVHPYDETRLVPGSLSGALGLGWNIHYNEAKALLQQELNRDRDAHQKQTTYARMRQLDEPFPSLARTLNKDFLTADQNGVKDFMQAVYQYKALVTALGLDGDPKGARLDGASQSSDPYDTIVALRNASEGLGTHSSTVDHMLKHLIDAFQADLTQMYIQPLVNGLQQDRRIAGVHGVALIGKTHMEVTSRQPAALKPALVSSVETTRPAPFTNDLLNLIAPSGAGGQTSKKTTTTDETGKTTTTETATASQDTTGLSGAAKLLSGLPQSQAALLAGALLNDVAPTYSQVAPGIDISIRPSMTPDGSSADLTLDSSFGVKTSALGDSKSRTDVWAQAEPDAVQSHRVTTQVYVSGFNLFDVSSFAVETATPQAPDRIPVISRLPVVGQIFQFPRGSKRVQHVSIILINAALRPSALGLIGFYGKSSKTVPTNGSPSAGSYTLNYLGNMKEGLTNMMMEAKTRENATNLQDGSAQPNK